MGGIPWTIGVAVGVQSALGTINATIRDLNSGDGTGTAGALTPAEGIVLGDPSVGVGESGIELTFQRDSQAKAKLANFTTQPSNFLREIIEGLTIGFPLKGNGAVISGAPADAEFTPQAGINALLRGLSLTGAGWGSGIGWAFTPATLAYLTVKVFLGRRASDGIGLAWVFQDCLASGSIEWAGGGIGVVTASLGVGSVADFGGGWPDLEELFPTFEYGTQGSTSAPVVKGAGHAFGATRGFEKFSLKIDNKLQERGNSNAPTGFSQRLSDRVVSASATLYSDDADLDFEAQEILRTTTPTNLMSFRVGTAAGVGATALGYQVRLTTPEVTSLKPVRLDDELGWELDVVGVNGVANGELSLIFD